MPSNEYYDSSGYPATGGAGSSASMRAELDAVEAGFMKLPTMAGSGGEPVFVNAGGTALESKSIADAMTALGLPTLAGNGGEPVFVNAGETALETKSIADTMTALGAESSSKKDASGGYAGLTLLKINFKNALNTITSFFTNANTAARTYTFPDKDGTVAMTSDLPVFSQTWQKLILSRALGTIYQNTTADPITVYVLCVLDSPSGNITAQAGAASPPDTIVGFAVAIDPTLQYGEVSFIVPPGWHYKVTEVGMTATEWNELR